ncbi:MAG: CAP domain-containing protein [Gloeobacteraceae cyanobacterium ES-bin-144]|nr:CAP domain-containing protein [Verrucomicrobiales bacterium]
MKTHQYTKIIAVTCVAALASCASKPETKRMPVSASIRPDSSATGRLFKEVNEYRQSKGKSEVERHAGLDRLAQEHCEYLRQHRGEFSLQGKNVSHIGFDGRTAIARERYQMFNISENVAAATRPGSNFSPVIVALWKGSKEHNKNMLDDWTHSGIGVVVDSDGMVFSTQLFSTVSYSQLARRERFTRH